MQEKLLDYVDRISAILAKNAKFGIYDEDDIKQEIFILVHNAQPHYDAAKGDEFSFFFHYVKNRLVTLKRDNYANPTVANYKNKLKINNAGEINEISRVGRNTDLDYLEEEDMLSSLVDSKIPASMRLIYLRLIEGVSIDWHDKLKVVNAIKNILKANNDKEI